ncbi:MULTISPECIES: fibronectin type III-like domain-contianing protein [Paenibacillus]|uniref:fibronectin type III-like domain-contianing protein n=1 Tax=Paenibacillus TaxID=44249 RepID=UPI000CFDAD44|nr:MULTISPECIES: fibronectin type III-like domain-contianing protein [Paenibacillus]MBD8836907.1 fibronectin type III-like domain-contianing protein [Paenibacillus sp. CFBP 13594]MCF7754020.1 fibronectin type III-like domain-contianing protein [Paenibacillus xylanexedens]PRA07835.1 hypothetical protein CQ043_10835 [Paenibacillus sp. MYb63]PRA51479.1 hypothetical protein CQ061_03990 [Paenibacillus sp. MYb67]
MSDNRQRSEKELKGFAEVSLEPNEEKTDTFTLDKRSFAEWIFRTRRWRGRN